MTLVDKLKEKLNISKPANSPEVPPKSSSSGSEAGPTVPPKSTSTSTTDSANPALPPKDTTAGASSATSSSVPAGAGKQDLPALPETEVFDHDKVTVIFVLGGPGAGESSRHSLRACA